MSKVARPERKHFYPRPPRGGRQQRAARNPPFRYISIHALREEGDPGSWLSARPSAYFYPRPPRGGRPDSRCQTPILSYFYPRPPRGGRLPTLSQEWLKEGISIHALREEGDSIFSLLVVQYMVFLSTPSARRATHREEAQEQSVEHFYPRPPRGGRLHTARR